VNLVGIFDGDCGICYALVGYVDRTSADPASVMFRPSSDFDDAALARLGLDRKQVAQVFVLTDLRSEIIVSSGADAINDVLFLTRSPLAPLLRGVLHIHGVLALERWAYALVARNRHRISRWLRLRACKIE
jgi:predicted DCC family thiol-disulfide oxidoreductase YuxK